MHLMITSTDGEHVVQVSVEPEHLISSISTQLQQQFSIPPASQVLLLNGNPIRMDQSFASAGVTEEDLMVLSSQSSSTAASQPAAAQPSTQEPEVRPNMRIHDIPRSASPELLLRIMEQNPHLIEELKYDNRPLAEALETKDIAKVRMAMMQMYMQSASQVFEQQEEERRISANPYDADAQARIAERIRQQNVQANLATALEETPEAFIRVHMLYIKCEVNQLPVKAFVDSGAQMTIMSKNFAEKCGLMRLVDTRYAGTAVGVGTAEIIGRVHLAPIRIGNEFYNCSFTIMDQQDDILFGLEMLRRHQCCIDLHKMVLRLNAGGDNAHEVPFLPESEVPQHRRQPEDATAQTSTPAAPTTTETNSSDPATSQDDKIAQLVGFGFAEDAARRALASTNGNVEMAAALLFENRS